ncbi:MAG TPA: Hpt domain-containing protein, partial [Gallionellaceae bacterium]|nr:Hpt domain-containing protein [Gallionellaceae bacterium]
MTPSAQFNTLPLLSVKPALDDSLDKIGSDLEQFFASNGEDREALLEAIGELHRAYGVLRMLSLDGVIVFCSELEKLLQEFAAESLQPSSMHQEVIQRALLILTHFLGALADGAPNAALRLFDPYQELLQARGIESAFAVDLFFPELNVELPSQVANVPLEADAQARIKAARSQYQLALLKWLRQNNAAEALQTMHASVLAVMACVPQDGRAFWWIAAGLLDCLIYDGLPPELNAKKLLGRIDLRMKSLADGTGADERAALNEMLYLVACSHAVSETVEEIKRCYALDEYLPEEPPLPPGETAQVLEELRAQLNGSEETWEKCTLQDETACTSFAGQAEQLHTLSERLDRNTLQMLCKQVHTAATHIGGQEYRQRIKMDMALALILLDSGIAHYAHLGDSFHEQVRILGQRLQVGAGEMPELQELVPLHCQMAQREITPLLAEAMSNNLQHVEQGLNVFFGNQEKREELALLVRLLNQVQGCLHMLSLDVAEHLLKNAKLAVARYADGGKLTPMEMRITATTISALGAYIHDLTFAQNPDSTLLQEMLQEITAQPPEESVPATPTEENASLTALAVQMTATEDNEMLEVFLEEAEEVLGILRTNLDLSQLHPESSEPLVTIRRGFHTLKGSGRMVGLNDLGEVAWAVERAMNKWLQENKPATPGLLQFIADSEALFHVWVDSLRSHSGTMINTTPLVAAAQQIESGEEP